MNGIIESGKAIIGGSDGPVSVFIAWRASAEICIAGIIIGLLFCFFGLKLARVLMALTGFMIGLFAGAAAAGAANVERTVFIGIMLGCAVIAAVLSCFLYKLGVFCVAFTGMLALTASLTGYLTGRGLGILSFSVGFGSQEMIMGIIALAVSLAVGIVAVKFAEPLLIIITAVNGGMLAGTFLPQLTGRAMPVWAGYAAGAALAVIGMILQFMMHSRKIGRKEKIYADEIKEKVSVESELEKARTILEDDEEEE